MIPRDLFARYVKDALDNLYNPAHLQTHPLAALLDVPIGAQGQVLRQTLTEALEALRPQESIPFGRSEWVPYRLMWLRYVEGLEQGEVCEELGIGRTSFYRQHREAFDAVESVLWGHYQRSGREPRELATNRNLSELARDEAVRVAHASRRQLVDLRVLLEGVTRTILPLAQQKGVTLVVEAPNSLPTTYGDPAMLRQIILNVLAEGVSLTVESTLTLSVRLEGQETIWRLAGLDASRIPGCDFVQAPGISVSRGLLQVYGGRFWVDEAGPGSGALCFAVPVGQPRLVLVIDDDGDTIALYQRYLESDEMMVRVASSGEEAWGVLQDTRPHLILLDVLMPQEDGWDILQRLKTNAETAPIPVVICSVLSHPSLALALGAAAVLQKPVDRVRLLEVAQELTAG